MEQSNHNLKHTFIKQFYMKFFFLLILGFSIFNVKCQNILMDSISIKSWKNDSCGTNGDRMKISDYILKEKKFNNESIFVLFKVLGVPFQIDTLKANKYIYYYIVNGIYLEESKYCLEDIALIGVLTFNVKKRKVLNAEYTIE